MAIRAVVFDIGGVLEITPEMDFDRSWEARLGLPAGEIGRGLGDLWAGGAIGTCTEQMIHEATCDRLGVSEEQAEAMMEDEVARASQGRATCQERLAADSVPCCPLLSLAVHWPAAAGDSLARRSRYCLRSMRSVHRVAAGAAAVLILAVGCDDSSPGTAVRPEQAASMAPAAPPTISVAAPELSPRGPVGADVTVVVAKQFEDVDCVPLLTPADVAEATGAAGQQVKLVRDGLNTACNTRTDTSAPGGGTIDIVIYPTTVRTVGDPIQVASGNSAFQEELSDGRRCDVTIALDEQGGMGSGASLGVSMFAYSAGTSPCPAAKELAEKAFERLPAG